MSSIAVNAITDASGGNTASINGATPTNDNLMGRNRIINGDMRIDQRNAGASVANPSNYLVDRWKFLNSQSSKVTFQQNAGSVTPPSGFTNYAGFTSSSAYSVLTADYFAFIQPIEGNNCFDLAWGTASAKTITISFWVRSSLTGTFGGALQNSNSTRSYPFTYSISAADTWEQKSITIAGDTSGTWQTGTSAGISVFFSLGAGATFSGTAGSWAGSNLWSATGATSVVGTSGATFYITGVQLEAGSVATSFERRQYGQELALCQRYFTSLGGDSAYQGFAAGIALTTTVVAYALYNLPVSMRSAPSVAASGAFRVDDGYAASYSVTGVSVSQMGTSVGSITISVASGLTAGRFYQLQANNSTAARLQFSSEL